MEIKLEEMGKFEVFKEIKIVPNCYIIARLDGKGFSRLTESMNLEKPFDKKFKEAMVESIKGLMKETGAILAFFESDEISLLFKNDSDFFKRRLEKLNSVLPSILTAECMSQEIFKGFKPVFDCRILVCPTREDVFNVFRWRQNDSLRNCLSGFAFWELVKSGKSRKSATKILQSKKASFKQDLLFKEFGINFNDVEPWKKNGTFVFLKEIKKKGLNPKTNESVEVIRNVITEVSGEFQDCEAFFTELNLEIKN